MLLALRPLTATLTCAFGLGLALYLALLKYFALPCVGPGECQPILFSTFGTVFRVPVGAYGALLWVAVILVSDRRKRGALQVLMAAISAVFMIIQFGVLRGFCLYCTLHALLTWLALWLHPEKPGQWAIPLGLALAGVGFAATRHAIAAHHPPTTPAPFASPAISPLTPTTAFAWLGPIGAQSPSLVVSLDCPACLDLLEELTHHSFSDTTEGCGLFFKTTDVTRSLTTEFVAAVLAQDASPREAFLAATALLLTQKDAALSSPATAAARFGAFFPGVTPEHRAQAVRLLAAQRTALVAAKLSETTPLLVLPSGGTKAFFKIKELFPN
jgi:uncharacterized membrane protein